MQTQWEVFCLAVSLSGLLVRILTVAYISEESSGRERTNPRAERLNTQGVYSLVRHPLYIGNTIIWLGVASMLHFWWLSLSYVCISLGYHWLIVCAEESYLQKRFGEQYEKWARKTPAIIPALHNWTPPDLPFSMVMVMRREYSGLFQIVAVFSFMDAGLNYAVSGSWGIEPIFQYLLTGSTLVCAALWAMVKRTNWLRVTARGGKDGV